MPKRVVGTFKDRFIRELQRQCDGNHIAISNKSLREALGWSDERFWQIRENLIKDRIVVASSGQGGKTKFVTLPTAPKVEKKSLKVFISYSHADERLKNALMAHLKPLEQKGLVESWSDRSIRPGDSIDEEIKQQLEAADIVLLLVSVDFINSKYCYDIELEHALERHRNDAVRIVPIILRDCLWNHSPFGGLSLLALPKDAKAVTNWSTEDAALKNVAEELFKLATDLLSPDS